MTVRRIRLGVVLSLAALPFTEIGAQTQDEVLAALLVSRDHAVHVQPDDRDAEAPHAVIVNRWTRPVTLEVAVPADAKRSAQSQVAAALDELDRQLLRAGASRRDIVRLNALLPGRMPDIAETTAKLLAGYLSARASAHGHGAPAETLGGVFELVAEDRGERAERVVLHATILDPRTATEAHRSDLGWDYQPGATRAFLIGLCAAAGGEALHGATHASAEARLDQLGELLAKLGARPQDIHELTVYYDPAAGLREADLRSAVDAFFPGGAPRVDYVWPRIRYVAARAHTLSGGAVAFEASGSVTHVR